MLTRIFHSCPSHNTCYPTHYKQYGMKNGELLIPIPGPLERHRKQGGRNPESDTICIIYPQNVHIFSYKREASTDRRPST